MVVEKPSCGAVILSGGLNTRMHGRNKAFLEVGGRAILDRLIETLEPFFAEILLVTREPELYTGRPVRVVRDIYQARASLTGLHAGLSHLASDFALVVPCDAPFLEPALIRFLLSELDPQLDAVVPMAGSHYEPLCAIYSKRCLAPIQAQMERGDFKITRFYEHVRLKTLALEKVLPAEARRRSFFNVNTPEALAASRAMEQPVQQAPGMRKTDGQKQGPGKA